MTQIDLTPATDALAAVVAGVRDDQLAAGTPCAEMTVAALLDHVDGLARAFDCAARKETIGEAAAPRADARHLVADWRTRIPERLAVLAHAWAVPGAWEGRTSIAGIDQTAEETGYVALDELVVHGWDLARATGQDYAADAVSLAGARRFVEQFASDEGVPGLFGPKVVAPEPASDLQALVALTGRDPGWRPSAG